PPLPPAGSSALPGPVDDHVDRLADYQTLGETSSMVGRKASIRSGVSTMTTTSGTSRLKEKPAAAYRWLVVPKPSIPGQQARKERGDQISPGYRKVVTADEQIGVHHERRPG